MHVNFVIPIISPPGVSAFAMFTPKNSAIAKSLYHPKFHDGAMRVTFIVSNNGNSSQELRLVFETARIRRIVCQNSTNDGQASLLIAGADVALSMWSYRARRPTFQLRLPIGEKIIFSCELESNVIFSPDPRIFDADTYHEAERRDAIVDGTLFGGLITIAWTCLMVGIFGRHRAFLVLALVVTLIVAYEAALRGYGQLYLWPEMQAWNYRSPTILGAASGLGLLVFAGMLGRHSKVFLLCRPFLTILAILYGFAIVIAIFGPLAVASKVAVALGGVFFVGLAAIGRMGQKRGEPGSKWILISAIVGFGNSAFASLSGKGYSLVAPKLAELGIALFPNPILAQIGLLAYLTVLAAWIHAVNKGREKATAALMLWQADEQVRLAKEIEKKTGQLTQALRSAESKQEKMTIMMGYIAHDLRAPLSSVLQYSTDEKALTQGSIKEFTQITQDSIRYVFTLIDELILYVEGEVTPLAIKAAPTDVNAILDMVSKHAEILARKNRNRYRLVCEKSAPLQTLIDGRRLSQLLLNLLSNAASYCHFGSITLEVSSKQDSMNSWELMFAVSDTGPGIAHDDLAHIFDPFFQNRYSSSVGGLGLHVAQTIAQKMGGTLTARSKLGKGTCFLFTLSMKALIDESQNSGSHLANNNGGCESTQEADLPIIPPTLCQRISELIDMGAVSEIEELIDDFRTKGLISSELFDTLKQDIIKLHFDRITRLCCDPHSRALTNKS